MKLAEKMLLIAAQLDVLAAEHGDYAVRRAMSRWKRRVNMDRFRAQERKRRLYRSVWTAALEGIK